MYLELYYFWRLNAYYTLHEMANTLKTMINNLKFVPGGKL
jgi:hypothetical protein